ncbi:MAG: ThuA domain-containing protein [Cyclobacteriaceae bacterium]
MKLTKITLFLFCIGLTLVSCSQDKPTTEKKMLKALIIDGENNHGVWPKTTFMMKDFLEQTGMFRVDIERTVFTYQGPHFNEIEGVSDIKQLLTMYPLNDGKERTSVEEPTTDPDYNPDFSKYDLVVCNFGWKSSNWSETTKKNLDKFVKEGGGLVIVHAANNAWGDWDEYNKMIGLGAWGDRDVTNGPYVYYTDEGELVRDPSDGICASHGAQYEFKIQTRAPEHPIMKGLPQTWLHTQDELYDRMRGPAENMTILATAYSGVEENAPPWDETVKGTGRHEPMLIAVEYGKGRSFHTAMGHMDYSMECVGFMTTFQRGAEWAVTGNVTQPIPADFPKEEQSSSRPWKK